MPKPSTLYTWATNANFSGGPDVGTPTKAAPSAGLQAEGFEPGQEPAAQNFNELESVKWLWLAFIDSLFDASTNMTLPANASYKVSGTGTYKHGSIQRKICSSTGTHVWVTAPAASPWLSDGTYSPQHSTDVLVVDIPMDEGEHLSQVDLVSMNSINGEKWNLKVFRRRPGLTPVQLGSTAQSSGSTSSNTCSVTGLNETCSASDGFTYYAEMTLTAFGAGLPSATVAVSNVVAHVDVP